MAKHERKTIDKVTSKMASVSNTVLPKHLEIDTARCDRKRKLSVGFTQTSMPETRVFEINYREDMVLKLTKDKKLGFL